MSGGETTDYGADGDPVPQEEVQTIAENMTEVMGDSILNTKGQIWVLKMLMSRYRLNLLA